MAEGSSVKDHLKTFDELTRQLKSAGAKLEEGDLVSQLFVTLPESFDPLVTALENLEEDKLTLDVVRERLLAEELKKNDRMTDVGDEVPAAFVGSNQKFWKFNGNCNKCLKPGHMAKDCKIRKSCDEPEIISGGEAVVFMTKFEGNNDRSQVITFKLDSGATDHLVKTKECFETLEKLQRPLKICVAKNNQSIVAWHRGSIVGVNRFGVKVVINDVLYVPELRENLLTVKKMAASDVNVAFKKSAAEMQYQGKIVAVCPLVESFYELELLTDKIDKKHGIADERFEPEGEESMDRTATCYEAEDHFSEKISLQSRFNRNGREGHNEQKYTKSDKASTSMSASDESNHEGPIGVMDRYVTDKRKTVRLRGNVEKRSNRRVDKQPCVATNLLLGA